VIQRLAVARSTVYRGTGTCSLVSVSIVLQVEGYSVAGGGVYSDRHTEHRFAQHVTFSLTKNVNVTLPLPNFTMK
jgi:hypothetical protein